MSDEPVLIAMTTWLPPEGWKARLAAVIEATSSWQKCLRHDGPIHLAIGDDGSDADRLRLLYHLAECWWRGDSTVSRASRQGVGASFNRCLEMANAWQVDHVLYAVDDWKLTEGLDLEPWLRLLATHEDIGCVRLGPPHPDVTGRVEVAPGLEPGNWWLRLDRHHFAFAHRPALYHRRFFEAYGAFDEGVNAYECEHLYSERFNAAEGPGVALALPHPWKHLDSVELAGVNPQDGHHAPA